MATGINGVSDTYLSTVANTAQKTDTKKTDTKANGKAGNKKTDTAKTNEKDAAVYEKSTSESKATYSINKMSSSDRAALVQQMKQDQEDRQKQLCSLVSQMLSKQAGTSNLASMFSAENLKNVDQAAIQQAKADVAEDGYWGVKQTSQRMFDFASALAGDDVEKMKKMQEAMQKGFDQATKAWGQDLPGICKDTIDAANQLFDEYYKSKGVSEE